MKIINVTNSDGELLASISEEDIIEADEVHVDIVEEE